jgi:uncharacterized protein (DUF1800 family)
MLSSLPDAAWDRAKAAHLLNRAGFGGSPAEIAALHKRGMHGALDQLFDAPDDVAQFPKPDWAEPRDLRALRDEIRKLPEDERRSKMQAIRKEQQAQTMELIGWWLGRMRNSPNPLREKMTLFWHGHFATSMRKVRQSFLMWQQNETLRRNALGNFASLVKAISRDPAMMIFLDTNQSRRSRPNENFARELMELFTLGIGNYTETDIREAARAFTGYKINPRTGTFRFAQLQHDDGQKEFSGETGPFDGDDIIDLILEKPACAKFIVKKVWEFFVYENPEDGLLNQLAMNFRVGNYEIRPLMRQIFGSAEFYSPKAVRTQIKSPVQWLTQTAKICEAQPPRGRVVIQALRQLGQVPFAPPSVKGWDGGKSWITTSTLLLRYNLAGLFVGAAGPPRNRRDRKYLRWDGVDVARLVPQELRSDPHQLVQTLTVRVFQDPLTERQTEAFVGFWKNKSNPDDDDARGLLHLMMSTPHYQLT